VVATSDFQFFASVREAEERQTLVWVAAFGLCGVNAIAQFKVDQMAT
jgi:hypothetical protein